jgi:hypothetical protein
VGLMCVLCWHGLVCGFVVTMMDAGQGGDPVFVGLVDLSRGGWDSYSIYLCVFPSLHNVIL